MPTGFFRLIFFCWVATVKLEKARLGNWRHISFFGHGDCEI
jgi:hypothetical protein